MTNRLASETSPYLLQHADNPVDWFPWGDEALDTALRLDKPILLSVGYSACHWCHVMAHESFENEDVAAQMNESFVCIKVDREERPDIDAIYMDAVQALSGHGGWPMTVFLTPEGIPFFGGTYFPPEDRHGLPSFSRLLTAIATAFAEERDNVETQGRKVLEILTPEPGASSSEPGPGALDDAAEQLRASFDTSFGGFGGAPKFPQPMTLDLLLRLERRGHEGVQAMVTQTLDAMADGGMCDQLGGGFHRYSVDERWLVPHFEKMLYDNALLLRAYVHSWQATGKQRHRDVAEETAGWMLREMRDPSGGFWSSIDADSEGQEGRFYVWTLDAFRAAAGSRADAAEAHWGVTAEGNFEGANILVRTGESSDPREIAEARSALLAQRDARVRPETDTKVLSAWNGLAASALAESGAALGRPDWIEAAAAAMDMVFERLVVDGRLMRSFRNGTVKQLGFAEDYAFCLEACLALFEATGEVRWFERARWAADEALTLFRDPDGGGFFTTGSDSERLIARNKDQMDNAIPAANSVMAMELLRLALLTGDDRYRQPAVETIRSVAAQMERFPLAFTHLLGALDLYLSEAFEIVILGERGEAGTEALLDVVRRRYLPNKVLAAVPHPDPAVPLLEGREPSSGKATAFVCVNMTCKQPVDSPDALAGQLGG